MAAILHARIAGHEVTFRWDPHGFEVAATKAYAEECHPLARALQQRLYMLAYGITSLDRRYHDPLDIGARLRDLPVRDVEALAVAYDGWVHEQLQQHQIVVADREVLFSDHDDPWVRLNDRRGSRITQLSSGIRALDGVLLQPQEAFKWLSGLTDDQLTELVGAHDAYLKWKKGKA